LAANAVMVYQQQMLASKTQMLQSAVKDLSIADGLSAAHLGCFIL
jgi:hypothetical protein